MPVKVVRVQNEEKWRWVANSSGFEVSSHGRIRVYGTEEIKKPTLAKSGYFVVNLYEYRKSNVRNIHSLVAEAFIGPRTKGHMVFHLDGKRLNNQLENLTYCSLGQRRPLTAGGDSIFIRGPKLSDDQSSEIRRRAKSGESTSALAQEFGVSAPLISEIKHNRKWRELGNGAIPSNRLVGEGFPEAHSQLGRDEVSALFWISDAQWEQIKPLITSMPLYKRRTDDRRAISGVVHVLVYAVSWGSCPTIYGSSKTLYKRYVAWAKLGLWERIFIALAGTNSEPDRIFFDYPSILMKRMTKTETKLK